MPGEHVEDLLPGVVAGTLPAVERGRAAAHLAACARCDAAAAEWRAIAAATTALAEAVGEPAPDLFARVEARLPAAPVPLDPVGRRSLGWLWQVVVGQVPLVRRGLWLAAPLVMAAGMGMALSVLWYGGAGASADAALLLALCAPALAAVGVALVYGPDNDPGLELALATRTPPRLVLLARLGLVVGYDLVLALLANGLVAAVAPDLAFGGLVELWLAPMALLSAGSLLLSLLVGPSAAIAAALAVWSIQLLAFAPGGGTGVMGSLVALWTRTATGPAIWILAIALGAAALWTAPRRRPA
jgi:hypothetical protein